MGGQLLDVDHLQIRGRKHTHRRKQGQIGIVLVIDGVVLVAFDQPEQVRNLNADAAGVRNQRTQTLAEVDDVRNMCNDIVCDDEVGSAVSRRHITTCLLAEEHDLGVDAPGLGHCGNVGRWVDPERSDAMRNAVLEQVAVVARHLNDEGFTSQP